MNGLWDYLLKMTLLGEITYESWIAVTQSIPFIITMLIVWIVPLIIYIIVASATHAKTSSGKKLNKLMIQSPNAWIPVIIWFFIQAIFILLLIIFPFWLNIIG